jgi:hypothetical protein
MFSDDIQAARKVLSDKVIAQACGVAPSTVDRWARGVSEPGQYVKTWILGKLKELIGFKPWCHSTCHDYCHVPECDIDSCQENCRKTED